MYNSGRTPGQTPPTGRTSDSSPTADHTHTRTHVQAGTRAHPYTQTRIIAPQSPETAAAGNLSTCNPSAAPRARKRHLRRCIGGTTDSCTVVCCTHGVTSSRQTNIERIADEYRRSSRHTTATAARHRDKRRTFWGKWRTFWGKLFSKVFNSQRVRVLAGYQKGKF